uniref:ABC-F type ribosomal protection protein n=1 Tax=Klebsiella pneumoniae TaxID=573 RepID=A0A8B0SW61_KLEPN|nr:ABC-F type ribosomal protection protein [Klebsiella pneumoniae]
MLDDLGMQKNDWHQAKKNCIRQLRVWKKRLAALEDIQAPEHLRSIRFSSKFSPRTAQ